VTARAISSTATVDLPCETTDESTCTCEGAWDLPGSFQVEVSQDGTVIASQEVVVEIGDCGVTTEHMVIDISE